MKEKLICKRNSIIIILVCIFLSGVVSSRAQAADKIDVAPYPRIEYGNTNNVKCGTIRYVQQNTGQHYYSNYWSPADANTASWNCYAASVSMALSYIGVNRSPGSIYAGGNMWSQPGATFSQPSLSDGINRYLSGGGNIAL